MNEFEATTPRAAIAHARVSTDKQIDFSIDRQLAQVREYAQQRGIEIVGEERLEGVSGLDPSACADVDRIIQRKIDLDDFDAIILADVDRLTRAGVTHGFHVMHMLNERGIQVLFARHDIPPGPYGWMFFALKCAEANADIKGITRRMHEGWQKAAEGQRVTHSNSTPYGCDKLVSNADGVPLYRVRRITDGSYKLLAADSETVLRAVAKATGNSVIQSKTQRSDRMTLVPGDPDRVAVVREIFELHYGAKSWGVFRIARHLNDKNAQSYSGKAWTRRVVGNILLNPCYLGLGIANIATSAKLMMRGTGPSTVAPPRQIVTGKFLQRLRRPKLQLRDPNDWRVFRYPAMEPLLDNLPLEVRGKALADLLQKLRVKADRQRSGIKAALNSAGRKSGGSRHKGSAYLLTDILRCEVDEVYYRGHAGCGANRYYINLRAKNAPKSDFESLFVPARVIEPAVMSAIQPCIQNISGMREKIVESIERNRRRRESPDPGELARLRKNERDLLKQIETMTLVNCDMKPEHLRAMVEPLKSRHREAANAIREIETAEARIAAQPMDVVGTADRVLGRLSELFASHVSVNAEQNEALRSLLKVIVKRLTIHPKTFAVNLEIGIPSWFIERFSAESRIVGLVNAGSASHCHEANDIWVDFARYSGQLVRGKPEIPTSRWKALFLTRVA